MIGLVCRECRHKIREHTKAGKVIGKTYILSYCNNECYRMHKQKMVEMRKASNKLRKIVLTEQSRKCFAPWCANRATEVHHIIDLEFNKGNSNRSNLVGLCHFHHRMMHFQGITLRGKYVEFKQEWRRKLESLLDRQTYRKSMGAKIKETLEDATL